MGPPVVLLISEITLGDSLVFQYFRIPFEMYHYNKKVTFSLNEKYCRLINKPYLKLIIMFWLNAMI